MRCAFGSCSRSTGSCGRWWSGHTRSRCCCSTSEPSRSPCGPVESWLSHLPPKQMHRNWKPGWLPRTRCCRTYQVKAACSPQRVSSVQPLSSTHVASTATFADVCNSYKHKKQERGLTSLIHCAPDTDFSMIQFRLGWYLSAEESLYTLQPVSNACLDCFVLSLKKKKAFFLTFRVFWTCLIDYCPITCFRGRLYTAPCFTLMTNHASLFYHFIMSNVLLDLLNSLPVAEIQSIVVYEATCQPLWLLWLLFRK